MGLPWIELHVGLPRHPKAKRLGLLLGNPRAWTHMAELWLWCAENCPSGLIAGEDADLLLEDAAGWTGERGRFIEAALRAGFVERTPDGLRAHGWSERAAAHVAKLERDAERQRKRYERISARFKERPPKKSPPVSAEPHAEKPRRNDGEPPEKKRTSRASPRDSQGNSNPNPNPNPHPSDADEPAAPPAAALTGLQVEAVAKGAKPEQRAIPREPAGDTAAMDWFGWAQDQRLQKRPGLMPEYPSASYQDFWATAMDQLKGDVERLRGAYLGFLGDTWAAGLKPAYPMNAFQATWRKHAPESTTPTPSKPQPTTRAGKRWGQVLDAIAGEGMAYAREQLEKLEPVAVAPDGALVLRSDDRFFDTWLEDQYGAELRRLIPEGIRIDSTPPQEATA